MQISKSRYFVFFVVLTVMVLSVTVFKGSKGNATLQQKARVSTHRYEDRTERYPVVDSEEAQPNDPIKRAKLKKQKERYDHDAPFTNPGPTDVELSFRPEWQFNFPALPVAQSDVIVIGQVLTAEAHRSRNKMNVFSNLQVRVEEVLKGTNLSEGITITVQRIGGFVKYPNGRKVLFRLTGNGMPAADARYAFFLNSLDDEDYTILTAYELGTDGVTPLDNSAQFQMYQGASESNFLTTLREAIAQAAPQEE